MPNCRAWIRYRRASISCGPARSMSWPHPSALVQFSARLPDSRVLADRFHAALAGVAVPKGQAGRLSYVSEFVEQAKASGLIQQAIDRSGVRGVQVAITPR